MSEAIFRLTDECSVVVPTEHARGPWDPGALHGGATAGLIAGALELMPDGADLPFGRLVFDFLRPVPLAPMTLQTTVVRAGRRVVELAAELCHDDVAVCRASALRVAASQTEPAPSREEPLPSPDTLPSRPLGPPGRSGASFASTAMEMRWVAGDADPGPATVWMRLALPLVEGRANTPLMQLAATADFGNGIAAPVPWDTHVFINTDLTIHLHRTPASEWIALAAHSIADEGPALTASTLHDEHGRVGRAAQSLVVQRRDDAA